MKTTQAKEYLRNVIDNSYDKKEIKTCFKFLQALTELEKRELSELQMQQIENQLDILQLDLEIPDRNKYLKENYRSFMKFVRREFSFVENSYYMAIFAMAGVIFGAFAQIFMGTLSAVLGLIIGTLIGMLLDLRARKKGRVLTTNFNDFDFF